MARIVALDYGKKRTGIAITDMMQMIASGLKTVATEELLSFLKQYFEKEKVEILVIGAPKLLDNEVAELEKDISILIKELQEMFTDVTIERVDERFTSKMAMDIVLAGGLKKYRRRDRKIVDKISATLILQSYMDSKQFKDNRRSK